MANPLKTWRVTAADPSKIATGIAPDIGIMPNAGDGTIQSRPSVPAVPPQSPDSAQASMPAQSDPQVDTVDVRLPDGKTVTMGVPKTPSIFTIAQAIKDKEGSAGQFLAGYYKVLTYVRAINGQTIPQLSNEVDFRALAQELGDQGMDICAVTFAEFWPPVTKDSLQVLKKNLR